MISVALMPCPIACDIYPICHQPDLIRRVFGAEHIHPDKTCGIIHQVWTENEGLLNLSIHVIRHHKPAQDTYCTLLQVATLPKELSLRVYAYRRSTERFPGVIDLRRLIKTAGYEG